MPAIYLYILILLTCSISLVAQTHHVGDGQTYASLTQAVAITKPGDTIMVREGNYAGGLHFAGLQGTAAKQIYIIAAPASTVVFEGGVNAWHLTDAAFVQIKGFIFQQQTGNGFNIDDGGTYATPSHHIVFDSCTFRNIKATGNNDLLKMSGVDFFEIRNCKFLNGAAGGSGIDMVGCHEGLISSNRFENLGSNSIQAKGGSKNIRIQYNYFTNGGERTLNLGGSTNLKLFRPLDARYEAAQLTVYSNIFIGSNVPIAFVGCVQTEVISNTIYLPQKWVIRILQETVDTSRFYPCGNNSFTNNIIYHDNRVGIDCNIGPQTNPQSFHFSNNLWYHSQNPAWAGPLLPVKEINSITGKDPLFNNATAGDLSLKKGSPATGKGYRHEEKVLSKQDPL
jgi:hypothetical protein